jgi:hypothetical protein
MPEYNNVDYLLNTVDKLFGLTTVELFNVDILLTNEEAINSNMYIYFRYAFPAINMDYMNKMLALFNINKTVEQIFGENKALYLTKDFHKLWSRIHINYEAYMFNEKDESKLKKLIRLYLITSNAMTNNEISSLFTEFGKSPIRLEINNDYNTNDIITLFLRTNNNIDVITRNSVNYKNNIFVKQCMAENVLCNEKIDINDTLSLKPLFQNKLEKISIDLEFTFIKMMFYLENKKFELFTGFDFIEYRNKLLNSL